MENKIEPICQFQGLNNWDIEKILYREFGKKNKKMNNLNLKSSKTDKNS